MKKELKSWDYKPIDRRKNWYVQGMQKVLKEDRLKRQEYIVKLMNSDISYLD